METILFENEICKYLNIPSIPKKEHDGKSAFKRGVAVTRLALGNYAYAVCAFEEDDVEPRVIKSFANEPFYGIEKIFVIPNYMETDVAEMDLDEESKKKAEILVQEAKELTEQTEEDDSIKEMRELPDWVFPEITSYEEAVAWLQNYASTHKLRGKLPTSEESIKMRLLNIYSQQKSKKGQK